MNTHMPTSLFGILCFDYSRPKVPKPTGKSALFADWKERTEQIQDASTFAPVAAGNSKGKAKSGKAQQEPDVPNDDTIEVSVAFGGLDDEDETAGTEREAAIKSPAKYGAHATSSVSCLF